jgi:hypothetical protein
MTSACGRDRTGFKRLDDVGIRTGFSPAKLQPRRPILRKTASAPALESSQAKGGATGR